MKNIIIGLSILVLVSACGYNTTNNIYTCPNGTWHSDDGFMVCVDAYGNEEPPVIEPPEESPPEEETPPVENPPTETPPENCQPDQCYWHRGHYFCNSPERHHRHNRDCRGKNHSNDNNGNNDNNEHHGRP